jgi:4-amino-4-deoxy-L-arabinose transferase-like glycosyltransferase
VLLLCLCWLLYLAQDLERSPRLALWAAFGLLAGFAGLTEPAILATVPFLLLLAVWRLAHDGKRWFLPGLVASLTLAAALSPWIIRNAVVFPRFIPMRDSMGMELLIGNNGYSRHWVNCEYCPMHNPRELAEYTNVGEIAYMAHKSIQAKTYIHDHPSWFVWMCGRRALYLWTGYWSFDPDYLAGESLDPANIPVATSLSLLAFIGLVLAWRHKPFETMRYGVILLVYPLMYYFVNPGAYRLRPIDPVIVVLASYVIVTWRDRVNKARQLKAAAIQA